MNSDIAGSQQLLSYKTLSRVCAMENLWGPTKTSMRALLL